MEQRLAAPPTRLVWAECPSNLLWRMPDIGALAALAQRHGAKLLVDATAVTSVPCRPLTPGADLMLHSATKYHIDVDRPFGNLICELHTLAHMLNVLVYTRFGGAFLTGAQLSADGTFRVDFDLPGADSERLRALEGTLNDVIASDLLMTAGSMLYEEAKEIDGMFRSKSIAPPPSEDGTARRRDCWPRSAGLRWNASRIDSSGAYPKIDNKGRQNRRSKAAV
ncbi:MAG: PLP-dependent transferase [Bosea sp. (in: a-proteobacteria)]|nr:PLP-dependent transferase [Bosea sp. (in: a-proteobacteria)]